MALEGKSIGLFTWLDEAGIEHTLDVDVLTSANDERTAMLSDHSVETGSVITDHVVILPESISLELVVTQTPIVEVDGFARQSLPLDVRPSQFKPGGFLAISSGVRNALTGLFSGPATPPVAARTLQSIVGNSQRIAYVHDTLCEILRKALLVTVSYKGHIHKDYLLTRVSLTSNPGEFGLGRFGVDARAFRTVTGVDVQLPDPADFRATPQKKAGNKGKKEVSEQFGPPPPPTSVLVNAGDGMTKLVEKFGPMFGFGG
jgi:hypothetical protein